MSVRVETSGSTYDVHIAAGAVELLAGLVGEATRVAVVYPAVLANLARRAARVTGLPATLIEVPDAESAKTPEVLHACWRRLAADRFTRTDLVVGLGGGTTTDLAGFVAATWLRGVPFVSVPTSVLGMVDAAVGGKTGINLEAGKNLVGAFYEPLAVLCDLALLDGLPAAEVRSGLAEVVKCGFIADASILKLLRQEPRSCLDVASRSFAELVTRAVAVKARVVSADLTERTSTGSRVGREALNYGHTLGHAIEAHAGYTWRHGQAISVGMAWIARVSRDALGLAAETVALHDELLEMLGLPRAYEAGFEDLRPIMSLDKKARGSSLRLVGLTRPTEPVILVDPAENIMAQAYREIAKKYLS